MKSLLSALALLLVSTSTHAALLNPSFEDDLNHWTVDINGAFFSADSTMFATDGTHSLRMWSRTTCENTVCGGHAFAPGNYVSTSQSIDLTLIDEITVDIRLGGGGTSTIFQDFIRADAYIGGINFFSSNVRGDYPGLSFDTSAIVGIHLLDFRLNVTGSGVDSQSDYFYVDNIRLTTSVVPMPAAVWLFGSGLLGLIGFARRGKVKPASIS